MSSPVAAAEAVPAIEEVKVCSVCNVVPLAKLSEAQCLLCFRRKFNFGTTFRISDVAKSFSTQAKNTPHAMPLHMGIVFTLRFITHSACDLSRIGSACDALLQDDKLEWLSSSMNGGEALPERWEDIMREKRKETIYFLDQLESYLSDPKGKRRHRSHWK